MDDVSRDLNERANQTIQLGMELPTVEFKEAHTWFSLRYKLTRTCLAMANNRDGGIVVVGVKKGQGRPVERTGVSRKTQGTYDHDKIYEFVNTFASPSIELALTFPAVESKAYVAIHVPALDRTPTICKKNTPDGVKASNEKMRVGELYIRPTDRIGTSKVTSAAMLEDLLRICANRRAAEMINILEPAFLRWLEQVAPGLSAATPDSAAETRSAYDQEVQDIADLI